MSIIFHLHRDCRQKISEYQLMYWQAKECGASVTLLNSYDQYNSQINLRGIELDRCRDDGL